MLGIIGGSGLDELSDVVITQQITVDTPYGNPSAALQFGRLGERDIVFLPRHGATHQIPPHQVNYRANIWAMQQAGVAYIVAVTAVGGISHSMSPGTFCVADQMIDYTYGREHTYFADSQTTVTHIDFTQPYCESLRQALLLATRQQRVTVIDQGVYAATQGPRLETAAEICRLQQDGCDIVGMTGMPEAALAKELGLCYANLSLVVNWAAGLGGIAIDQHEMEHQLAVGMQTAVRVLCAIEVPA